MERVAEILQFWFGDGSDPEHERRWFAQDAGFDQACRTGFLADHQRAAGGELDNWKDSPLSALALILLLDQFPRNIFRGTPRAFATDSKALATAKDVVARGFDLALPPVRRSFIYLPFQHSENLDDQQESVQALSQARRGASRDGRVRRIRRASHGRDPPLRPLSASQCGVGPRLDVRRDGVPPAPNLTTIRTPTYSGLSSCISAARS